MGSVHSAALESAKKGDVEAIKKMLERSDVREWLNKGDKEDKMTALHWASSIGHLEVVKLLLASGANINCCNNTAWTPLHLACIKGHVEVVKLLLSSGALVDVIAYISRYGQSAISKAFNYGHASVVDLFIAMELKGQLNYRGGDGGSLLHIVCEEVNFKLDLVKRLLEGGLNASKRDKKGRLPVDCVSDEKKKAEVSRLINGVTFRKEPNWKEERVQREECNMPLGLTSPSLAYVIPPTTTSTASTAQSSENTDDSLLLLDFPPMPTPSKFSTLPDPVNRRLSFEELDHLSSVLMDLHCYTEAYGALCQAQSMKRIKELSHQKMEAVENDDLELAMQLREAINESVTATREDEKKWLELASAGMDKIKSGGAATEASSLDKLMGKRDAICDEHAKAKYLELRLRPLNSKEQAKQQLKAEEMESRRREEGEKEASAAAAACQREADERARLEREEKKRLRQQGSKSRAKGRVAVKEREQRKKEERAKELEVVTAARQREAEEKARLERGNKDRLSQLEEENQLLKRGEEQHQSMARSSHNSDIEEQSSRKEADELNASMIGASSLGSYGAPSGRGAANKTQLPLVPPVTTVKDSSVTGASSLSSTPVSPRRDRKLETASPPVSPMNTVGASSLSSAGREKNSPPMNTVGASSLSSAGRGKNSPPMNTVGASSLSSAGREKEQRSTSVSQDNGLSLGARVVEVHDVKLGEVIGQGAFGKVYKGECDFQDVAVKVFECGSSIPEEVAEKVRQEVQLMCQLSHPNIVRLYGLVERADSPPMLVMEFGAGGSLYSYLRRRDFADRPWSHRLRIAFELSRGLAYLHKMNVVHRDIKSLNVILDEYGKAMWCDFGLSVTKEHVLTTSTADDVSGNQEGDRDHVAGTLRWLAPEQFSFKHSTPSRASDVWSLGMVLFEIASQQVPYSRSTNKDVIKDWIKAGEGEEVPDDCEAKAPVLADLMRRCWSERSARPSAAVIAEELKAVV